VAYKTQFVRTLDKKGGGGNFASGKNAVGICHRSGFKFPYSELVFEPGTNFLVHKSENDGSYSVVNHPQNYPPSSDKLVDKIGLKWAFPDEPLSLGTVVSASDFFRIDSLTTNVGIHLDFRTNHYYSRTSSGATNEANFASFANFNRNSIATYWGPDGLIKYAGPNEPRIEYSPTGEFLGYLVETSATNLFLQNTNVGTSPWGVNNSVIQSNVGLAPDGTMTADRVMPIITGSSVAHATGQSITTVLSNAYTFSFYAKPDGIESLLIQMKNGAGSNSFENIIDITAAPSVISRYTVGTGVNIKTSVVPTVDGWIYVKGSGVISATDTSNNLSIFPLNANREVFFIGTSVAGFYLWGVQVEQGEHATSMIPTTTAVGVRPRDRARVIMPPAIYSSVAGTMAVEFVDAVASVFNNNQFRVFMNDSTYLNTINLGEQDGKEFLSVNANGGFNGGAVVSVKTVPNQVTKVAGSWSDNNVVAARNGQEIVVDAIASVPTGFLSAIQIGSDHNGFNNCVRTHIRKIDYWPYQKTNQELVALSSVG
jgi:hypothetical protein